MKKFLILSLFLVVGVTTASLFPHMTAGQKVKFQRLEKAFPNKYIVVLNEKYVDSQAMEATIDSESAYLAAVYGGKVGKVYAHALKGFSTEMTEDEAIAMSNDDRVAFVEQDAEIFASAVQQSGATWGIDRIDQRNLPLDTTFSYDTNASNVHAYVIDSGIRATHVEFGGRATADFDAIGDGQNGNDCNGHGTHVAGSLGASTWGVAKNVRIHAVRVLPCTNSGDLSSLIAGIDWVKANHASPAVANISINLSGTSNALNNAVNALINSGVTVAVSAGNYSSDACGYGPANVSGALVAGAVGYTDQKAPYSNYGSCIDVWGPGTVVWSVSNGDNTSSRVMSGTSMASPHVAGVAALYLALNPTANPATVQQAIKNAATTGVLGGLDASSPNKLLYSWVGTTPPSPTPTPTPTPAPSAARVTIKKRANTRTEGVSNTAFPYAAVNLGTSSFALQPNNQFDNQNVTSFGSSNMITVTEAQVYGWQLTSISCVETSGGTPNVVNSTVDLLNRKANIVAEPGETVECTFTSDELAPTASYATISGRIVTQDGKGVRGFVVSLLDATDGSQTTATTNSFGYYTFNSAQVSHLYVLTANSTRRVTIQSSQRIFTLNEDLFSMDFIANR